MRYAHLIFGAALFFVFTITGRYMRADFPDKEAISPELRLLIRSRHIYILFSALLHILAGVYVQLRPHPAQRIFQYGGSATLFAASVLLVWAFFHESYGAGTFSDISRNGIYASLLGIGLHIIGGFYRD